MLKKLFVAGAVAAAAGASGIALAQAPAAPASPHTFTGNIGVFSEYVFRGLTQTNEKPALQGGLDYSHSSGLYVGLWGSNVSWISDVCNGAGATAVMGGCPSVSVEIDTYIGFKNTIGQSDFGYDLGFLRYNYPGDYPSGYAAFGAVKPNTNEIYGGLSWKWLSAKLSYSLGDTFGFDDAKGSYYAELNAAVPIGSSGFTLSGHIGHQKFKGGGGGVNGPFYAATGTDNDIFSYSDWKIGVNKEWWGFNFGLAVKGTDADETHPTFGNVWRNAYGKDMGKTRAVVSVQKTF